MFVTPAYAQAAGAASSSGGSVAMLVGQFVLLGAIFWFLIIRPQQKKLKEHRAKIDSVKKGDTVVTGGGIIGKVTKVDEHEVEVEIASQVKIKVVKATLTDVQPLGGAKPAND
ncbi:MULTISPECIES: preprotein translocase subunit YajC [Sphingomonadales]|uniref:Sec translocon accessory complex subunit YajC n=2 Tax=Edaphosphingomonas TaxID=3423724 RepID=A0A2T4HPA6_9SPHN|nr:MULTISPECIES: preprotein translocase subunit YajC [Sphingomonas]AGH49145.1 protein translocase subunit yajC [Sphingomonas sp. MM-1]MDX3886314.1 preprotein translocase subunit YajC [Sphingomonas sp.]OHT21569.1 preprotein translocase subunit YajC [Sphingomonas haloaromaticamans]PTD17631.1 preprotein translocase subunit YajC [Sphingomonas fennica]